MTCTRFCFTTIRNYGVTLLCGAGATCDARLCQAANFLNKDFGHVHKNDLDSTTVAAHEVRTLRLGKSSGTLWNFIMDMKPYENLRILRFRVIDVQC